MEVNEWVVVASRSQAKIFKRINTQKPLRWIMTLVNEEARTRIDDIRDEVPNNYLSTEAVLGRFTRKIVDQLKSAANHHSFQKLHVFAEPHLLGRIKEGIPKCMKDIEISWHAKDLEKATTEEIHERVS